MKDTKNLDTLQTRPYTIGDDISGIRNHQFMSAGDSARVAKRWVVAEQVNAVNNPLRNNLRGLRVFLGNIFRFIIQVFERFP